MTSLLLSVVNDGASLTASTKILKLDSDVTPFSSAAL